MITSGSMENTPVDIPKILRRAIEKQCSYVIMVHNHPSGSAQPGPSDSAQTNMVKNALSGVGVSLMDHVIVAEDSFFSFADERLRHL